jgi:2-C-methyl-D-erythritol 4-phosphate cytidylyltransferase
VTVGAVIVGAGSSTRAGFDKVFAMLAGEPVLLHSLRAFGNCQAIDCVVVVLAEASLQRGRDLVSRHAWGKPVEICAGGRRRQDSVWAGLARLPECEWVAIHDAARPLVTVDLVEQGLAAAAATGAAVAAVPVTDTIKLVDESNTVRSTPKRASLWAVQTPQVFRCGLLREAYAAAEEEVTDDASLLERQGQAVRVYPATPDNIKITLPGDLALAEFYLERRKCRG